MSTDNDVIEILAHPENLAAAFAVLNNFDSAIIKIMNDFLKSLKDDLPDGFTCKAKTDWHGCLILEYNEAFREGIYSVVVESGDCPDDVIEAGEFRVFHESKYCTRLTVRCKEQCPVAETGVFNRIRLKEPFFAQVQLCLANSLSS